MSDFEAQFEQPIQETAEQVVQLYETSEEEENAFVSALVYNQKDIPENLSLKAIYSSVHQKFSHDPLLNSKDPYSEESSTIETRISRGPIQLVKVNDNGTFEVCKQGAELLKSIKSKIGVVSIGGPSRCGKSFIMNLLSNGSGAGFEVGSRVAACTQGI